MKPRVVLLNDTATRYHHGCSSVMDAIVRGLESRDLRVTARSPARHDWETDASFLDHLGAADLVVVNGEGTLHHGAAAGERLLRVAGHPAAARARVALINALYHANQPEWSAALKRFDLLAARDSASARELEVQSEMAVTWLPDLSLTTAAPSAAAMRHGVLIGDAVRLAQRKHLLSAFERYPDATFLPTKTLRQAVFQKPGLARFSRALVFGPYMGRPLARPPRFEMPVDVAGYLNALSGAALHITGRFHGVCLSLVTRTPFLAVTSTSGKIEKLLHDLGLGTGRIIDAAKIAGLSRDPSAYAFSPEDAAQIDRALADARTRADGLFDALATLARETQ
ncbi:MAG: polysaccharide pyruvyl transferase family protein [Pseudomonadota bacterium]